MRHPSFLITNDDGIESPALAALVNAMLPHGRVQVVAPAAEQSWIGKAISRRRRLTVRERKGLFECPTWEVDGTPADCVNLGLGNLVKGRIDAVLSGINTGSNVSLPLILCSGTVGGALEGAFHGRHAIASSIRIARHDIDSVRNPAHPDHAQVRAALHAAAQLTAERVVAIVRQRKPRRCLVHNLNFPPDTSTATNIERTIPANVRTGTLFQPTSEDGVYEFIFGMRDEIPVSHLTDRISLEAGHANHSILDFGRLGVLGGSFGAVSKTITTAQRSAP